MIIMKKKKATTEIPVKKLSKLELKQIIAGANDKPKIDKNVVWAI
jgi:hypothetical protein